MLRTWCSSITHAVFLHPDCLTVWFINVGFVHLPNGTTSQRFSHKLVCVHTLSLNPGVMWHQHLTRYVTTQVYDYWRVAIARVASLWLALPPIDRPTSLHLYHRHWAWRTFRLDYRARAAWREVVALLKWYFFMLFLHNFELWLCLNYHR